MLPMEDNLDLVVFVDEAGEEKTMEVLEYFFYEGIEYAVLIEYCECEDEHDHEDCDCGHAHNVDAFIMKVTPVEDDQEEFLPVEDEALMNKLIDFVQNELYDDEEHDGEEDDDEYDDDRGDDE